MNRALSAEASTVVYTQVHGITAAKSWFRGGISIEPHTHATGYVSVTLAGSVIDTVVNDSSDAAPGYICWIPPETPHANRFGVTGAACLLIEVERVALSGKCRSGYQSGRDPLEPWSAFGGALACRGMALHGLLQAGVATSLDVEEFLARILAEPRGDTAFRPRAPAWLVRIREMLDAEYADPPSLSSLAIEADVHPMHLIRAFRQYGGCTPGQYVQTLRVTHACRLLTESPLPLSMIARHLGFHDQSHFTRAFRARTGWPPGAYRSMTRSVDSIR